MPNLPRGPNSFCNARNLESFTTEFLDRLSQEFGATFEHGLPPAFIVRTEDLFQVPLRGMVQSCAAVVMPTILLAQRLQDLRADEGAELLADEIWPRFCKQPEDHRV